MIPFYQKLPFAPFGPGLAVREEGACWTHHEGVVLSGAGRV